MRHSKTYFQTADKEIIDSLLLSGVNRQRGEEKLFNSYSYFIREAIRKYSLSHDEAFDAYSDSILSAIETIVNGTFEERSTLKTYLYQIFHNKCVDRLRKIASKKSNIQPTLSITDMLYQIADAAKSVIQQLAEKTDLDLLKQKLNELGDNCRKLLLLSADGYSDKEIAVSLEYKTAHVVKSTRLRCMEKLRQLYKRS